MITIIRDFSCSNISCYRLLNIDYLGGYFKTLPLESLRI